MTHEPRIIQIPDDSELARALDAADTIPVRLERGGVVFRVSREQQLSNVEPARVATATDTALGAAGSWAGLVNSEELKRQLRDERGSHRPPASL